MRYCQILYNDFVFKKQVLIASKQSGLFYAPFRVIVPRMGRS